MKLLPLCLLLVSYGYSGRIPSYEEKCLSDILGRPRNIIARPIQDHKKPINVSVQAAIAQLVDIDAREQTVTVTGFLKLQWNDMSLTWKEGNYDGLSHISIPAKNIWVPDIGIANSTELLRYFPRKNDEILTVYSNGVVTWFPGGKFTFGCALDLTYFPFDRHVCTFDCESWTMSADRIRLIAFPKNLMTDMYQENAEWVLMKTEAKVIKKCTTSIPEHCWYSYRAHFFLKRKSLYYIINIIFPIILMSVCVQLVYLLPPEAGEKVSLGITVLVAFSVFQVLMADILPRASDNQPIIVLLVSWMMLMTVLSITISVVILRFYYKSGKPVPFLLSSVVFNCMAPLFCTKRVSRSPPSKDSEVADSTCRKYETPSQENSDVKARDPSQDDDEWKEVARIFDRFFMVISLVANIVVCIFCFIRMTVN